MKQVQCHLITPATSGEINIMTWVDEALKPKTGMVVPMKGDPRVWTVLHAYSIPREEKV
jgi:hypothetical protein